MKVIGSFVDDDGVQLPIRAAYPSRLGAGAEGHRGLCPLAGAEAGCPLGGRLVFTIM
jgi:hypothetical protein